MLRKKLYSIFFNKCPRCHKGDFFKSNNPYKLKKFDKMHKRCPVCDLDYEREIGFYYGAMYVSYALAIALGVGLYILLVLLLSLDPVKYFLTIYPVLLIVLSPVLYRMARLMWINFFIRYKKDE